MKQVLLTPKAESLQEQDTQVLLEHIKAQEEMLSQTTNYLLQIQEQLESSRQALYNQNKSLEQVVEERTAQLRKAVSRLEREVAQREQAQQKLSVVNQELNMLLYRSSHDFKGPVCTAFGLLSLIDGNRLDPEVQEYLSLLQKPLHKLDSLTKTITSIADCRENQVNAEAVDFDAVIDQLLTAYKRKLQKAYPEVLTNISVPAAFYTDQYLLENILQNLLNNAFQYRVLERPHQVSICIQPYYKQLKCVVSDTGAGIPEAFLPRVFDMFFRGSEQATGSGLGLYLAKLSVAKLQGSISIKSQLNKGTTVTVVLPNLHA